jgi:DNA-binding NtrC family response regulator
MSTEEFKERAVDVITPDGTKHNIVPYEQLPSVLMDYENLFGGTFKIFCVQHSTEPYFDPSTNSLKDLEAKAIRSALVANCCNKKETAKALGIARGTLYRKMKILGITMSTEVA